jgi:hypothetical protein
MTDRVPQDLKNIEAASGVTKQPNSTPSIKWTLAVSTRHAASRACVQTATCMISNVVPGRYNVKVHQQRGDPRFVPTVVDVKTAIFQAESASSSLAQSLPLSVQEVLFDASSGMYLYSLKHALGHAEGISLRCPETYTLELSSGKDVLFGVQSTATTSNQSADQKDPLPDSFDSNQRVRGNIAKAVHEAGRTRTAPARPWDKFQVVHTPGPDQGGAFVVLLDQHANLVSSNGLQMIKPRGSRSATNMATAIVRLSAALLYTDNSTARRLLRDETSVLTTGRTVEQEARLMPSMQISASKTRPMPQHSTSADAVYLGAPRFGNVSRMLRQKQPRYVTGLQTSGMRMPLSQLNPLIKRR